MSVQNIRKLPDIKLRMAGKAFSEASGGFHDHMSPITGRVQARIPLAGKQEMDQAIDEADQAFHDWRARPAEERRDFLFRLADLVRKNAEEFARLAVLDGGTAIAHAKGGPQICERWIRYYAGWADKIEGQVTSTYLQDKNFSYTLIEPYGVIGIIITWNGPLISLGMKVPAALAAGNTVVVKPSEMTPFAPDLFAQLVIEAGIPRGVCTVLPGAAQAGEALIRNAKVQKVSFTGGAITARKILAMCAEELKPSALELGGKSANIVFPDCDLERAANHAVHASIGVLAGQGCGFPTRLLVHESVYDDMVKRITAIAAAIPIGDPFDDTTSASPVINQAACDRILGMVDRAQTSGAGRLVCGGKRRTGEYGEGFYIEPTIFVDVDPSSEIAQTEVFGPVLSVIKFSTEEEAIAIANNTQYGLAAYIQTSDVARLHRVAERLRTGAVYTNLATALRPNTPFGGIGISGFGREGGRAGLDEFLRPKTVVLG
jgi:aldehyde dehydrogenase (NAD+)